VTTNKPTLAHRLLHGWAVLTVVATVCLLALGSVVTTFRVGMADPVWPTYPWHLLLIDWSEPSAGFLIEHTHRLAGYIVGVLFIVLALGTLFVHTGRKIAWLGLTALGCVIVQGLLGGFRVKLNALVGTDLAVVHGTFAQVVFSVTVAVAVITSPRLVHGEFGVSAKDARRALRLSVLLTAVAFCQVVWGALLRQTLSPVAQRGHLFTAFAVVALVAWLGKTVFGNANLRFLSWPVTILAWLVAVQVMLGIEAYVARFASATLPELVPITFGQVVVRSLHVLIGSWILAAAVTCSILSYLAKQVAAAEVGEGDEAYPPLGELHQSRDREGAASVEERSLTVAALTAGAQPAEGRA